MSESPGKIEGSFLLLPGGSHQAGRSKEERAKRQARLKPSGHQRPHNFSVPSSVPSLCVALRFLRPIRSPSAGWPQRTQEDARRDGSRHRFTVSFSRQRHLAAGSIAVGDSSTAAGGGEGEGLSEGWTGSCDAVSCPRRNVHPRLPVPSRCQSLSHNSSVPSSVPSLCVALRFLRPKIGRAHV